MPAEVAVAVAALPNPLSQLKETPPPAVSPMDVVLQVNSVVEELMDAVGTEAS